MTIVIITRHTAAPPQLGTFCVGFEAADVSDMFANRTAQLRGGVSEKRAPLCNVFGECLFQHGYRHLSQSIYSFYSENLLLACLPLTAGTFPSKLFGKQS